MNVKRIQSVCITVIFWVLIGSLFGGCVSKQRYQDQVNLSEDLARQLEEEKARRSTLEGKVAALKRRLEAFKSDHASDKKGEGIREGLQALEGALDLAGEMGDEIEKILQGNLKGLKEEYEETLEKTKKEILKFKDRLENDEDLLRLRKEIRKKIEELLSVIDKIDSNIDKN